MEPAGSNEELQNTRTHYDRFLARYYTWMAGGFDPVLQKNRDFFAGHAISSAFQDTVIDLGAGCGFQSIPLAEAGFRVIAVDSCRSLLEELELHAGTLPVTPIEADILDFPAWAGHNPALITCMGDTLTHLPDMKEVRKFIRECHSELMIRGNRVITFRDYSQEPDDPVVIIPVRSEPERIFLCRMEYRNDSVLVTDILYSRDYGKWERTASAYSKIRIDPVLFSRMIVEAGFSIEFFEVTKRIVTVIARKTG
jgi:predicted RNA methylase